MIKSSTIRRLSLLVLLSVLNCDKKENNSKDKRTTSMIPKNEVVYVDSVPYIYRGGKPYYVKGAASNHLYDQVGKYGGNSIRTYHVNDKTQSILDMAYQQGLSVVLGIGLKKERDHNFDYDDEALVREQFETVKEQILKFKDHPAILMWGIGNELDIEYTKPSVWNAVEDISKFIKSVDTLHLTSTILAGADVDDFKEIIKRAPSLDVVGVNVYADIVTAHKNVKASGWKKPYLITEWGPKGTWDNPKSTDWGRLVEPTSTEKANNYYKKYYQNYIYNHRNKGCVGSYVFVWGYQHHGAVQTWYGLFTKNGNPLNGVYTMQECWTGESPDNTSPEVYSSGMILNGKTADQSIKVKKGVINIASVDALDLDGDSLYYEWQIVKEGFVLSRSDKSKAMLPGIPRLIENNNKRLINFKMDEEGEYRLIAYVLDHLGNASVASIPFLVQ